MTPPRPVPGAGVDVLVVGSARSGTTLVQRLACELEGVAMPPETHFFDLLVPGLLARGGPPLERDRLVEELRRWQALEQVRGLDLDVEGVVDDLGGRCTSLADLFDALVLRLAPAGRVHGEKTPKHLLWWRPLLAARPGLKLVAVVRDPRAVVASNLAAPWAAAISSLPWGERLYVAMAERWRSEQQEVLRMAAALGPQALVLRYEDVVADPAAARGRLSRLLDVPAPAVPSGRLSSSGRLVLPWETWKASAVEEIRPDRGDASRHRLPTRRQAVVAGICAREMGRLGYALPLRERLGAGLAVASLDARTQRKRVVYRRHLAQERAEISAVVL